MNKNGRNLETSIHDISNTENFSHRNTVKLC